jgi:diguanylate cyclase (GGDEF)-like protein
MMAGAVPLLSPVSHAYWCFAIPVVLPISIRMMWVGDRIHLIMGLMIVIFGLAMLATSALVHRLFRDAEKLRRELYSAIEVEHALEYLVRLDSLTGIPNRRLFEEELSKEWARAKRDHAPFSLIMADIDHFKEYNDHYGHPAGDLCLVDVAQAMHHALSRPGDVVARIGGEEFAFLLPQTDLSGAIAVAEQIRERILALNLPHEASPVASHVTLSFGVSSSELASISSPAELIRTSDIALYEAKRCGRNQIMAAPKTASDPDRVSKGANSGNF